MTLRVEVFPADVDAFVDFYWGSTCSEALAPPIRVDPLTTAAYPGRRSASNSKRRTRVTDWPVASGIEKQPWGLRDFRLFDPDGYYLRLTERAVQESYPS